MDDKITGVCLDIPELIDLVKERQSMCTHRHPAMFNGQGFAICSNCRKAFSTSRATGVCLDIPTLIGNAKHWTNFLKRDLITNEADRQ